MKRITQLGVRSLGLGIRYLAIGAAWLWSIAFAYSWDRTVGAWVAWPLAAVIAVAVPLWFWEFRRQCLLSSDSNPLTEANDTEGWRSLRQRLQGWLASPNGYVCLTLAALMTLHLLQKPRHDRQWGVGQSKLPTVEIVSPPGTAPTLESAGEIKIRNIRSLRYGPTAPGHRNYYDDLYDINKLKSVWFGVDRFSELEPLAHTFLSFEFEPGTHKNDFLAFSVETRREQDELSYSPLRGMFNNYELIYVVADEQDVLSVRSNVRKHVVQLYPIRATPAQLRKMFVDILSRLNEIDKRPEFYHTLTNNCTNNIVAHSNKALERPISIWQRDVIFPGYSDWLAHRLGILDTELSLTDAREAFRIDDRVQQYSGTGDFSRFIRAANRLDSKSN